jgi:hypothetical protein
MRSQHLQLQGRETIIQEEGMKLRIPSGLGLSVVSAVAAIALVGCGGETGVGPGQEGTPTEAVATTSAIASNRTVDLGGCDSLRASAESRLVAKWHARGVQIYRWDGTAWVFVEPSASLYAGRHNQRLVATHYAGPTWESRSGSKVVGSVSRKCTPTPNAIPWLLLNAASTEGHGIFRGVTQIQRLETVGGLAPERPGSIAGEMARVPYTADYAFYKTR